MGQIKNIKLHIVTDIKNQIMEVQKCVLLIYGWLKEHGLHSTCAALANEYGSSVASETPLPVTLSEILLSVSTFLQIYTNSSLSTLLTTLKTKPPDPGTNEKPGKSKAAPKQPRKRKASVSKDSKTVKTVDPVVIVDDAVAGSSTSNAESAVESAG